MFYGAVPEKRRGITRRLKHSLSRRRPKLCCIINRYADDPTRNLLEERLRFVRAFGVDIDIYGCPPWNGSDGWQEFPNYLGPTADKQKTLSQYTFVLAFENSDSDGYITEKIVQALLAGTIPLYWGGGKYLQETIPAACFINCRHEDPERVHNRIKQITQEEVVAYRKAGIDFLNSRLADRFTRKYWATAIAERLRGQ